MRTMLNNGYAVKSILFFGLWWCWSNLLGAEEVALLVSSKAKPYQQVVTGFKHKLDFTIKEFNMESDERKGSLFLDEVNLPTTKAIVLIGTAAVKQAEKKRLTIPLVYTMLLKSPKLPGHQTSGVKIKLGPKVQLKKIKQLLPNHKRIGIVYNPTYAGKDIEEARTEVTSLGLTLMPIAIREATDISNALNKLSSSSVDLIWLALDRTTNDPRVLYQIGEHTYQQGLPFIGLSPLQFKLGITIALTIDLGKIGEQTANLTSRLIAGKQSATIEEPEFVKIIISKEGHERLKLPDLSDQNQIEWVR